MEKIKNIVISACISCVISLLTFFALLKTYPDKQIQNIKISKDDSLRNNYKKNSDDSLYLLRYLRTEEEKRNASHEKLIDSLNAMLIREITGSGSSKKEGYGPRARELKNLIDSLRIQYRIKAKIDSGTTQAR